MRLAIQMEKYHLKILLIIKIFMDKIKRAFQ